MNTSKVKLRDMVLRLVVDSSDNSIDQTDVEESMCRSFLEISPVDVFEALQWLKTRDLIAAQEAWGGSMFAITATPLGEDCAESGMSVAELMRPRMDNPSNIYVKGQTVQFNQGNHVNMNQIGAISVPSELQDIVNVLKKEGHEDVADETVQVHRESGMSKAVAYLLKRISDPALAYLGAQIMPMAATALEALQ